MRVALSLIAAGIVGFIVYCVLYVLGGHKNATDFSAGFLIGSLAGFTYILVSIIYSESKNN